ncbi:uncharacterized protein LOC141640887 [Silene latifolia]|uniref:uncharacterized protein LOC141640887 n=1 Tax=Silene latifolia TaxID=37657 RepID=UPI003D786D5B
MEFTIPAVLLTLGTTASAWWFYPIEKHIPKIINAREKSMEVRRQRAHLKKERAVKKKEEQRQRAHEKEEERRQIARKEEIQRLYDEYQRKELDEWREKKVEKYIKEERARMEAAQACKMNKEKKEML